MEKFIRLRDEKFSYSQPSEIIPSNIIKPFIDGWIIKLFPYSFDGERYEFDTIDENENLPQFLVECPMKIIFVQFHKTLDATFKSGFVGVKQDLKTYEIKPEIGWYLIDGNGDDIFTYKHKEIYKSRLTNEELENRNRNHNDNEENHEYKMKKLQLDIEMKKMELLLEFNNPMYMNNPKYGMNMNNLMNMNNVIQEDLVKNMYKEINNEIDIKNQTNMTESEKEDNENQKFSIKYNMI